MVAAGDRKVKLAENLRALPPLHLKLTQTSSFLNQLESVILCPNLISEHRRKRLNPSSSPLKKETPSFLNQLESVSLHRNSISKQRQKRLNPSSSMHRERLKAAHCHAKFIRIGSWQAVSENEGDLTVKFYYATKRLVLEVLQNGLKSKIEIQWSDISAIRAILEEDKPGILEIEVHQPPTFYKESDPRPRHHSLWTLADDFTGGEALTCRKYLLQFAPGVIDQSYVKLLGCDTRLFELSRRPFPSHETSFFVSESSDHVKHTPEVAIPCRQTMPSYIQSEISAFHFELPQIEGTSQTPRCSTPAFSSYCGRVLDNPSVYDRFSNSGMGNAQLTLWDQGSGSFSQLQFLPPLQPAAELDPAIQFGERFDLLPYGGEVARNDRAIMNTTQQRLPSANSATPIFYPSNEEVAISVVVSPSRQNSVFQGPTDQQLGNSLMPHQPYDASSLYN